MLNYILDSGVYGTVSHQVENAMSRNGWGKLQYALNRFLEPISGKDRNHDNFEKRFPFFYKHRLLLPLLPFYRTFCSIKAGRFQAEAKALKNAKN
jgi:hypothetical protein